MAEREKTPPPIESRREEESVNLLKEFKYANDHQKIRDYFLSTASPETEEVTKILEKKVKEWNVSGTTVELRMEGSLNYGQVSTEETRDIDIVYMSDNLNGFEQAERKNEVLAVLKVALPQVEDVEMDIIDLSLVENYVQSREKPARTFEKCQLSPYVQELFYRIAGTDSQEDPTTVMSEHYFEKFLDYFWVNRPLGGNPKAEGLFERAMALSEDPVVTKAKTKPFWDISSAAASQETFTRSFAKYVNRLQKRGIPIPHEIAETIQKTLT